MDPKRNAHQGVVERSLCAKPNPGDAMSVGSPALKNAIGLGPIPNNEFEDQTSAESLEHCVSHSPSKKGFLDHFYHWFEGLGGPC
jgi:hypothetical protein